MDLGLLTAAQLLDVCADPADMVLAKYSADQEYSRYPKNHWKGHSRFKRGAGEAGSNLHIVDAKDSQRIFILGNNYPLGDGRCLGTTIPLDDNRPGTQPLTASGWFRLLNSMFWLFDAARVNQGVLAHLKAASRTGTLQRVRIVTRGLSDAHIEKGIRLSTINGGGSNGANARGTATYCAPSEWTRAWPPKEIAIRDGLSADVCSELMSSGMLALDVV